IGALTGTLPPAGTLGPSNVLQPPPAPLSVNCIAQRLIVLGPASVWPEFDTMAESVMGPAAGSIGVTVRSWMVKSARVAPPVAKKGTAPSRTITAVWGSGEKISGMNGLTVPPG